MNDDILENYNNILLMIYSNLNRVIESLWDIKDKFIKMKINIDMDMFENKYWYLYFYNVILAMVLIYLFYKLSTFNNTLTNFNNNDVVVVHKKHVYKIIKRLKEEISSLKEENNTLKNEKDKYIQDSKKKQIKNIPSNQECDELEKIRHVLSSDDRAAKKICIINNMLNTENNNEVY
jgi:cell division protein FtsB